MREPMPAQVRRMPPGKRAMDLAASALGLLFLGPFLIIVTVIVRTGVGAPALFRHARLGHGGREFTMLKFRTMRDEEYVGEPEPQRITKTGRLLRRTSIDELPQLWNVFRGEMSLIGPRPLPVRYLDRFSSIQARRHDLPPGITGWAQVNGRNRLTWEDRLALDVWYVDHRSPSLDVQILWRTMLQLIRPAAESAAGPIMEEFQGRR